MTDEHSLNAFIAQARLAWPSVTLERKAFSAHLAKHADQSYARCTLPSGAVCEEYSYFKTGKCP